MKNYPVKDNFILVVLLLSCFYLGFSNNVDAQSTKSKYQTETIYLLSYNYVKNEQKYPIGFFGNKLKKEMEVSTNAMAEFSKFEKNRNYSFVYSLIGLGSVITGSLIDEEKEVLRGSFFLGGLVSIGVSIPFGFKARKHFSKSLWIRNSDVLK